MATYNWTQAVTDTFTRANTTAGAAGTTTGLGNNWIDFGGNVWSIVSNTASAVSQGFQGHEAVRPLSETPLTNANQRIVFRFVATATGSWIGALRIQTNGDYYYVAVDPNLTLSMFAIIGSGVNTVGQTTLTGITYVVGNTYEVDVSATGDGATSTTLTAVVRNITAATTSQTFTPAADARATLANGGAVGLAVNNNAAAFTLFTSYIGMLVGPLTASGIRITTSAATITLNAQTAQGGTSPYSYQWYRSTAADVQTIAGNLVASATSITLVDTTASPGTRYSYALTATDSAATPATVKTLVWSAAPSTVTNWLAIGDSITFGDNTTIVSEAQAFVNQINALLWPQKHTMLNKGQTGSATPDWLQGSPSNYLVPATAAAVAAGVTNVLIMLGTNDGRQGVTAATYLSNMSAIIAYIKTQIAGVKVYVNVAPFENPIRKGAPFTVAGLAAQDSYVAQIQSLASSTVFVGDQTAQSFFAQRDADMLFDGVHPNDIGAPVLGGLWAKAFIVASQQGYGTTSAAPSVSRFIRRF